MNSPADKPDLVLLSAEELSIEKQRFVTADVRVVVETLLREVAVKESLVEERVDVERVAIGRYVDIAPAMRQEGDTTIISLVEEVIERRLILREEIHLRSVRVTRTHEETVALREEKLTVERTRRGAPEGPATVRDQA